MRNLKRALSLALASVMLLGMMVVGTGASYNDADSIEHTDAVAVLNAIGVMTGDDQGNFNPDQVVTRAEMAVIICNILYGDKLNISQFAGTSVFSDVPTWAQGFVNLAASLGIVAGVGDGKYAPNDPVTTAQATLMLCKALGYFQNAKEFGNDWALAAITRGTKLGLFGDMRLSTNEGLKRDDVAELVFNTLTEAVPVMYNENFDIYYNDSTSWVSGVNYTWLKTLGYTNFDLVYQKDEDSFGRPTTVWGTGTVTAANLNSDYKINNTYAGIAKDDEIVTVADAATYTYTAKMTGKDLYGKVGKTVAEDYVWDVTVDGDNTVSNPTAIAAGKGYQELVNAKSSDDAMLSTGNGVLTEVYVDTSNKTVEVVITNTYVAEVTKVTEDDGEYTITIRYEDSAATSSFEDEFVTKDSSFAKENIVLATVASNEIKTLVKAEAVSGEITALKGTDYVKVDGTQYNKAVSYRNLTSNNTAMPTVGVKGTIYVDAYGNMIAFDGESINQVEDFLYVVNSIAALDGVDAKVVFTDGTEAKIFVSDYKSAANAAAATATTGTVAANKVYTYTESDGEYTLTAVTDDNDAGSNAEDSYNDYTTTLVGAGSSGQKAYNITKNSAAVTEDSYSAANTKTTAVKFTTTTATVFVDADNNKVYTGYQNVPSMAGVDLCVVYDKDGNAKIVFITDAGESTDNDSYFYVGSNKAEETKDGGKTYREYTVFMNGAETTLMTKDLSLSADSLYKITGTDSDGNITAATQVTGSALPMKGSDSTGGLTTADSYATYAKNGVLTLSGTAGSDVDGDLATGNDVATFVYDDNTQFITITAKRNSSTPANGETDEVTVGSVKDIVTWDGSTAITGDETIVYVVTVDDKTDTTPLATLVIVIEPAYVAAP